jgi:hypothetical protein
MTTITPCDKQMRRHASTLLLLIASGLGAFSLSCVKGFSQPLNNGTTNWSELPVTVFFTQTKTMSLEEIKDEAIKALTLKGHKIESNLYCAINIQVGGKDAGCSVILQDLHSKSNMLYTVDLDKTAKATVRYVGPVRHGTPRFGPPWPGYVPPGGVKVNP